MATYLKTEHFTLLLTGRPISKMGAMMHDNHDIMIISYHDNLAKKLFRMLSVISTDTDTGKIKPSYQPKLQTTDASNANSNYCTNLLRTTICLA